MRAQIEEIAAAASALGAYLTTVLPAARRELRGWGPLPEEKARNAEAVAVFATLAPRSARPRVVRAIVALQVAIDLRDRFEEAGEELAGPASARLGQLEAAWRREAAKLPRHAAVAPLLDRAVARCEEGQRQTHAAAAAGSDRLRSWAQGLAAPGGYRWWELAAGASSSVAAHALIAAAADPATDRRTAAAVDAAYFPPVGALTVLLDDLADRDLDLAAGEHSYLGYYEGIAEAAGRLAWIAGQAALRTEPLQHASRHRAILAGVGAYYLSLPSSRHGYADTIRRRLIAELGPSAKALALFQGIRRLGGRRRPEQAGNPPGPCGASQDRYRQGGTDDPG